VRCRLDLARAREPPELRRRSKACAALLVFRLSVERADRIERRTTEAMRSRRKRSHRARSPSRSTTPAARIACAPSRSAICAPRPKCGSAPRDEMNASHNEPDLNDPTCRATSRNLALAVLAQRAQPARRFQVRPSGVTTTVIGLQVDPVSPEDAESCSRGRRQEGPQKIVSAMLARRRPRSSAGSTRGSHRITCARKLVCGQPVGASLVESER